MRGERRILTLDNVSASLASPPTPAIVLRLRDEPLSPPIRRDLPLNDAGDGRLGEEAEDSLALSEVEVLPVERTAGGNRMETDGGL